MAASRYIERICALVTAVALLAAILLLGVKLPDREENPALGYEDRLFDTTRVHTIDIRIDDWEGFLSTARSEEYTLCHVVIDGKRIANVGIRGKGNTSLSSVASMDSDRYSFKIEFDQYDSSQSYYGLDKLSLNNLIQDNTMMKDYLVYRMMNEFGVAAPLCSYAYLTVNGEDWGLYLAVEAVEESFLRRNYGSDYGELYKPDSMSMGGGRGNGQDFSPAEEPDTSGNAGQMPGGMEMPEGVAPGQNGGGMPGVGGAPAQMPSAPEKSGGSEMPGFGGASAQMPSAPEGSGGSQMPGFGGDSAQMPTMPENSGDTRMDGNMGGGMGMGAEDVKLQYIDDDPDSYSAIFDSAKTDVTAADRQRLIDALKTLSSGENPEDAVAAEAVIRYFVVHNFVVNADSYTGSMVHNYYLYEADGRLSMIPWDYNLAFGTFQGGNAAQMVNDDIDAPLSVTGSDRPMIDWILNSGEYTALYHEYFAEFLSGVDISAIIENAHTLIAPYVERDPTKFCTYEEFEKGVQTLTAFCSLRTRSVSAQLAGEDGMVDTSGIRLSDMGTMGGGMGGSRDRNQTPGTPGEIAPEGESRTFEASDRAGARGNAAGNTGGSLLVPVLTLLLLAAGLLIAGKYRR